MAGYSNWTILLFMVTLMLLCICAEWPMEEEEPEKESEDGFPMDITDYQKEKLMLIFDQIDVNKDGYLVYPEMYNWTSKLSRFVRQYQLKMAMKRADENGDGWVTWPEYLHSEYNFTREQLYEAQKAADKAMNDDPMLRVIREERDRFISLDTHKNASLPYELFDLFSMPRHSPELREVETKRALSMYDKDLSDTVDFDEYMESTKGIGLDEGQGEEDRDFARHDFDALDKNNDTILDRAEIGEWMIPSDIDPLQSDTEDLLTDSDKDGDDRLTREEVLKNAYFWAVHEVTNEGNPIPDDFVDDEVKAEEDADEKEKKEGEKEEDTATKPDRSEL